MCVCIWARNPKNVKNASHNTKHIIAIYNIYNFNFLHESKTKRHFCTENRYDVSKQQLAICGRWLFLK